MQDAGTHAVADAGGSADGHWLNRAVDALGEGWAVVDEAGRLDAIAGALFEILDSPRPHGQAGARLRESARALRSEEVLRWPPQRRTGCWRWNARRQDGRQVELEAYADGEDRWLLRARWSEPAPAQQPADPAGLYHATTRLPQQPLLLDRLQQAVERSQRTVTHRFALLLVALDALADPAVDRALLRSIARQLEEAVRPADTVAHLDRETLAVIVEPVRGDDATVQVAVDSIVGNLRAALDGIPAEVPLGAAASFAVTLGDGTSHPSDLIALARSRLVRRVTMSAPTRSDPVAGAGDAILLGEEWALDTRVPAATVARCVEVPDGAALIAALDARRRPGADRPEPPILVLAVDRLPSIEAAQALKLTLEESRPVTVLVIELDEAAIARDPEAAIQFCDAAISRGIEVAIGRFGRGRCPEALVARLPLSRLSFDPALTADARHAAPARVRLAAAIAWAHERGLQVAAEEIAEPAHAALLASLGCGAARGPLFEAAA
ncbi:MAG: EAL domain-containing protein [Alphaproteobacteria bacterium]